jgi:hypothetical protein
MDSAMNLIDEIKALVAGEQETGADDPIEARLRVREAISGLLGIDSRDDSVPRWYEYEIAVGVRSSVDEEAEILGWLRTLEIAAAPEVAAVFPFGSNSVLVRRYWACPSEHLIVPEPLYPLPWPEPARTRFRRDMAKLAKHGRVHPWARGLAHMYVSDRSGTILLNAWSVLKTATEREQRDFLESIDFQLQRRT